MISNVKPKKHVDSSTAMTVLSLEGGGASSAELASNFETHLSELIAKSDKMLRMVIQNRIASVRPAHERNKKWYGKIINIILKEDCEYIELNGIELLATIKLLNEEVDIEINPRGTYLVPFVEGERILTKLNSIMK